MDKEQIIRRTARISLFDEMQTQARTENPHGAPSARTVAIRKAAIRTLAALSGGDSRGDSLSNS